MVRDSAVMIGNNGEPIGKQHDVDNLVHICDKTDGDVKFQIFRSSATVVIIQFTSLSSVEVLFPLGVGNVN